MFVKWLDAGGPTVESDIQPLKLKDLEATGVLQWYNVGFKLDKVGPHRPLKNNKRPPRFPSLVAPVECEKRKCAES